MRTTKVGAFVSACAFALVASGASADDIAPIFKVKTKASAKSIPVVCPLYSVDGNDQFHGLTLPRLTAPPCLGQLKAVAKISAFAGNLTATLKVTDKASPGGAVVQQVSIRSRMHPDGCGGPDAILPELTFVGPAQGLPDIILDTAGKGGTTVTAGQILVANPGIFPSPRPLCPSDVYTIRHLLLINNCCYEATFTIHHAG